MFFKIWKFSFLLQKILEIKFVEYVKIAKSCQWNNDTGNFICLYITWKKWKVKNHPQDSTNAMEMLWNIWWKSLHRNSRYCQNHPNGVTSCFPKMVIKMKKLNFVLNHQNIGCKLLPKEEKKIKSETWPFTHYQMRSSILNHCGVRVDLILSCHVTTTVLDT